MGRAVALDLASGTDTGAVVLADSNGDAVKAARAFVGSPKVVTAPLDVTDTG